MTARHKVVPITVRDDGVTTPGELVACTRNPAVRQIVVCGQLVDVPSLRLLPGQTLVGEGPDATISFAAGCDGLELTTDNEVTDVTLLAAPCRRAICNDTTVTSLGRMRIARVTTIGQVQILAKNAVRAGHVEVSGLDIVAADTRARDDLPKDYGVAVMQGAFTLWNMQDKLQVVISASLKGLVAGRAGDPVLGSGVFVGGAQAGGGRVIASLVETGAVYSDGRIAAGTADRITGGVFVGHGAHVEIVHNRGPVVTCGANDMVLDNWGFVDRWIAEGSLTSYGPSGIGFVNFGTINELRVQAPIETFGQGARGFNVYAGSVDQAEFDRITTHADGAVGVQVSRPIGRLFVRRGIETFGGTGASLVRGVVMKLAATGLSVMAGGAIREVEIAGGVTTNGKGIAPIEMHGEVGTLLISGGAVAQGGAADLA
jgi:hypothetical protein